jgi:hypothetical protein
VLSNGAVYLIDNYLGPIDQAEAIIFPSAPSSRSLKEMVGLRLAISSVLIAAMVAACITYIAIPSPPERIEVDRPSKPAAPKVTTRPATGMPIQPQTAEDQLAAFQRAADAIMKRSQNANASAGEKPIIMGPVPLPRKRPVVRP